MSILKYCLLFAFTGQLFSCRVKPDPKYAGASLQVEKLYTLANEKFIFNPIIDTTAIYVAIIDMPSFESPKSYSLLRFSNDGLCYLIPNSERQFSFFDYNTFSAGKFCRYKIDKNNVITLEFYRFHNFVFWFGKVTDDRILF